MPAGSIDWHDDRGQVAGIEMIPFGLLVFVVGALLVTNAWAVIDVKFTADAAAREATRAFVEAPDETLAIATADRAARDTVAGHGRDPAKLELSAPAYGAQGFVRCGAVTITASYPVPAVTLPLIGGAGRSFTVTSSHSERIDPYRSGLGGRASCA